jgi:3-oxoacyl-[acyl-carrier protein] reductase
MITGGGTGIGRAIAAAFAGCGDVIVITGRREEALERAAREIEGDVRPRKMDVSRPDSVEAGIQWLVKTVSPTIDVLVNNAGGILPDDELKAPLDEAARLWDDQVDSNLKGSFLVTVAALPHLRRPGGRIINMSSIAAFRGGGVAYSAAKAGVVGLTYALARELGGDGISVNAVAPGLVLETEFFGDRMTPQRLERTVGQTPLGRAGAPADIAATVLHLASDAAAFVTGQVLHVNGGWHFGG